MVQWLAGKCGFTLPRTPRDGRHTAKTDSYFTDNSPLKLCSKSAEHCADVLIESFGNFPAAKLKVTIERDYNRLNEFPWREILVAAPAMAAMAVALRYYGDFVSDDAFISFRYAQNLAAGKGLEWNPGYRVEGYSNFLWVLLLAALNLIGLEVPAAARALSAACALATVVLVVGVARRGRRTERTVWTLLGLAPLPLVLSFPYQYWCAMRLETSLYSLLLLLAPALFLAEEERRTRSRWPSALAYLALALTRPEGGIFIIVPLGFLLARLVTGEGPRVLVKERWLWLSLFAGGMALFLTFRLVYFGELLPNTFYAKMVGSYGASWGFFYLERFLVERPYHLVLFLLPLILGGTRSAAGLLFMGTTLTLAMVAVLAGGDWMREYRLLIPATPLLAATLGFTLQRSAALSAGGPAWRLATLGGMLLLVLGLQVNMGTPAREWAKALSGKQRDLLINLEGEMTRTSRDVATWLRANAGPSDLIAVNHAGAVPFYSGLPTLDMVGLNDLHIARITGSRHGKWDPDYVLRRRPRFVLLNTRVKPTNGVYTPGYWQGEDALYTHPQFLLRYEPIVRYWTWRHTSIKRRSQPDILEAYVMVFRRKEKTESGLRARPGQVKQTKVHESVNRKHEPR